MKDDLGNRMKEYELAEAGHRLDAPAPHLRAHRRQALLPLHRGAGAAVDARLSRLMVETAKHLVEETVALVGYTQSDEISLLWHDEEPEAQLVPRPRGCRS